MLPPFPKVAEVVIIGGGVVGLSIAYHLTRRGATGVVVLEKSHMGSGSTRKAAGGIRHQFGSEIDVRMSLESIKFYERFQEETGFDINFKQNGYLFLASTAEEMASFEKNVAMQRRLGLEVELLSAAELQNFVPWLKVDEMLGGTFCSKDGYTLPLKILEAFAACARRQGAVIHEGVEVYDVRLEANRVTAVMTKAGTIATPVVVNAAGPYAYLVARMVGVDLPVSPHRRHVFYTAPLPDIPDNAPMVIDNFPDLYFRKGLEGELVIGGGIDDGPPTFHPEVPWEHINMTQERLARLVPALSRAKIVGGWAGLRSITPDREAILGPTAGIEGFICANGFSGHGVMHAPATGRIIAELILDGVVSSLDIRPLSLERFHRNKISSQ